MSWREKLRPGSFRGVPFLIDASDHAGGRRQVVHEFPQRDDPLIEDLGLKPHEFRIDCFVLGEDYMAARDALIAAAETKGPGTLVHPYRGSLPVACLDYSVRETSAEGGIAYFSLTFIASAAATRQAVAEDTGATVEAAAAAATAEAEAGFLNRFSVQGVADFVADAGGARVTTLVDRVKAGVDRLGGAVQRVAAVTLQLQTIRADVLGYIRRVPDLAGAVSGLMASTRLLADTPRAAYRELRSLIGWTAGETSPGSTPARAIERRNAAALDRLVTLSASAEAARAVTGLTFGSYDDAIDVRDDLAVLIDQAALALADAGDDRGYQALTNLRLAVVRDITRRGGSLARVYAYTPIATEPALVTAHRLYGDAARAEEIIERNRLSHPGFVPAGVALEVLTDV